ncbi:MAG TPA: alpha-E domain-containing protein [Planctomycetota bacterium]
MLARAADSMYWIGRYVERAENIARLIDVHLHLQLDLPPGAPESWKPLVGTTGDLLRFLERYDATTRETALDFLAFDEGNPNSILSCLRSARENARSTRDILSAAQWEHLNATFLEISDDGARARAADAPYDFFGEIRLAGRLFEGLSDDTMLHGEAWHFGRLGRFIERADKISRVLDLPHFIPGGAAEEAAWSAVLESAGALELYRKRHGRLKGASAVDFLFLDREFPRSAHFCLAAAEESLHALTGTPAGTFRHAAEQRLGQLRAELAFARGEEIVESGLHDVLDAFQLKLNLAGDAVGERFFVAEEAVA